MKIAIHPKAKDPLYVQIYDAIVSSIASGELTAGDFLPSMRKLARDLQINFSTVSKAYSLLESESFVSIGNKKVEVIGPSENSKVEFLKKWKEAENLMITEARAKKIPTRELAKMYSDFAKALL